MLFIKPASLLFRVAFLCVAIPILASCGADPGRFASPFYDLPRDGLAEVSRYKFSKLHYGVPLEGSATLIVVRENINTKTYQKTNKKTNARPGVKVMLMKTLPSMNWDHRDNYAVYSGENLTPLRLAITAEEWCGNNFLELMMHGNTIKTYGRPYTDDLGHKTGGEFRAAGSYYLYEQLPVLARALAKTPGNRRITVLVPQSAYLLPSVERITLTLSRAGTRTIKTPAGTFETIAVRVESRTKSKYFPAPETYWVEKDRHFIVRAERNEIATELGKFHASRGLYELTHYARTPYWGTPVPPASPAQADRRRATHSAYTGLNIQKWFQEKKHGKFTPARALAFARKSKLPREYLSSPRGNNSLAPRFTGRGGWYFDASAGLFKVNFR